MRMWRLSRRRMLDSVPAQRGSDGSQLRRPHTRSALLVKWSEVVDSAQAQHKQHKARQRHSDGSTAATRRRREVLGSNLWAERVAKAVERGPAVSLDTSAEPSNTAGDSSMPETPPRKSSFAQLLFSRRRSRSVTPTSGRSSSTRDASSPTGALRRKSSSKIWGTLSNIGKRVTKVQQGVSERVKASAATALATAAASLLSPTPTRKASLKRPSSAYDKRTASKGGVARRKWLAKTRDKASARTAEVRLVKARELQDRRRLGRAMTARSASPGPQGRHTPSPAGKRQGTDELVGAKAVSPLADVFDCVECELLVQLALLYEQQRLATDFTNDIMATEMMFQNGSGAASPANRGGQAHIVASRREDYRRRADAAFALAFELLYLTLEDQGKASSLDVPVPSASQQRDAHPTPAGVGSGGGDSSPSQPRRKSGSDNGAHGGNPRSRQRPRSANPAGRGSEQTVQPQPQTASSETPSPSSLRVTRIPNTTDQIRKLWRVSTATVGAQRTLQASATRGRSKSHHTGLTLRDAPPEEKQSVETSDVGSLPVAANGADTEASLGMFGRKPSYRSGMSTTGHVSGPVSGSTMAELRRRAAKRMAGGFLETSWRAWRASVSVWLQRGERMKRSGLDIVAVRGAVYVHVHVYGWVCIVTVPAVRDACSNNALRRRFGCDRSRIGCDTLVLPPQGLRFEVWACR